MAPLKRMACYKYFSHSVDLRFFSYNSNMALNKSKKRSKNLSRRRKTVFKKVHELGQHDGVDVALIVRQNGQYFTYRSIDLEYWPPSMKEIVSL